MKVCKIREFSMLALFTPIRLAIEFRMALFYFVAGQSNSNSDTCAEFRVKYVGAIEKLKHNESKSLEGPLDLINYIDVAQVSGLQKEIPTKSKHLKPTCGFFKFILWIQICKS